MVVGIGERVTSLPVVSHYKSVKAFHDRRPDCSVLLLTSALSTRELALLENAIQAMPIKLLFMRCDDQVDVAGASENLLPMVRQLFKTGRIGKWVIDDNGEKYRRYILSRQDLRKLIGAETVVKNPFGSVKNQITSLGGVIRNVRKDTPAENQRYLINQGNLFEVGYACNGHKRKEVIVEISY